MSGQIRIVHAASFTINHLTDPLVENTSAAVLRVGWSFCEFEGENGLLWELLAEGCLEMSEFLHVFEFVEQKCLHEIGVVCVVFAEGRYLVRGRKSFALAD